MQASRAVNRPVVTISASYGAGGGHVGRELARRLGARLYDREIPAEVGRRLGVPLERALAHDESTPPRLERLLGSFAWFSRWCAAPTPAQAPGARAFSAETERLIHEAADAGGAVLLGRAAALVLGDAPGTLNVRLDGPRERRVGQAMRLEAVDEPTARRRLRESDRAHDAYARCVYGADPHDPRLYHLVLDSTAVDLTACVDLVTLAAYSRFERNTRVRVADEG